MIETCTTRRMLLLIIALLISSTIVLLFEEYVEDSELEASRQLRQNGKLVVEKETPGKDVPDIKAADCQTESLKLVEECQPCSSFEMTALKSDYCKETGYYSKFLCEANQQTVYSVCYAKQLRSIARFHLFAGITIAWSGLFFMFVSWRRQVIEMKSYSRLSQYLS